MLKTIQVTENDIKNGRPCNAQECAVARAIARHLKRGVELIVGRTHIHVGDSHLKLKTPEAASDFIQRFDDQPEAQHSPITFTLDIPSKLLKATAK